MTGNFHLTSTQSTKEETYRTFLPQLEALLDKETDMIANLSNLMGAIKQTFGFLWVGVYFVKGKELVLGPFQGPVACTRIGYGKGVCGKAWMDNKTIRVDDVDLFPGHIACNSESKSEMVLPALKDGAVFLVLDIDSAQLCSFDPLDQEYFEKIIKLVEKII